MNALRAVIRPSADDWADAGTMVRFAVGNDHRGTVYPAAVAMTEKLLVIIERCPGLPRRTALAVLDDWWAMFDPEPELTSYVDGAGTRRDVVPEIVRRLTDAVGLLTRIAEDATARDDAAMAATLLTAIRLGWGHSSDD